ncbi:hypothetical protein [Mucilaginibacter polytrichastri]|uniref:Uncharacterized protein n=1 Tax=Mucilaginibacter polytrichastri TaxID=1302689 RepID=A0A1Q5ZUY5_9SPHI|nr:hypothetical protein [Mucilaginibacter polytrichastri]OKS85592.1 hypothetical protein RG47T_1038 [Mucilaginibacter polytrichastri]SFS36046.1 hypothetical protein SAMN04487890_10164 [Mucilaginibacter polytrichastri]
MGEKLDLQFTPQSFGQLLLQHIPVEDFLTEVFKGDEGKNYQKMCSALKAYHHQNGGAPEVVAFETDGLKFDLATLSGSFVCKFKVSFFFGCDDLYIDKLDSISWQFKIDKAAHLIHFTGEEPWSIDGN